MFTYDPVKPLIFSHIPKSAGQSVQVIFREWFGKKFNQHYSHRGWNIQYDTTNLSKSVIYGHFNRARGAGLEQRYPEIEQVVTILRNPWERVISGYFYRLGRSTESPAFAKVSAMPLEDYLSNWPYDDPDMGPNMFNFLPKMAKNATLEEYVCQNFIAVGITEKLEESLRRIALALGKKFEQPKLPHVNVSRYTQAIPLGLRSSFEYRNADEFELYEFVARQYS